MVLQLIVVRNPMLISGRYPLCVVTPYRSNAYFVDPT